MDARRPAEEVQTSPAELWEMPQLVFVLPRSLELDREKQLIKEAFWPLISGNYVPI